MRARILKEAGLRWSSRAKKPAVHPEDHRLRYEFALALSANFHLKIDVVIDQWDPAIPLSTKARAWGAGAQGEGPFHVWLREWSP